MPVSGRVLLTGVSGFIGGHVALALLRAGYTVRGSLRDMGRAGEIAAMLARAGADTGRLEFVRLDLSDDAGWREAAAGCRYLQHVASPLGMRSPRQRDELIRPAVEGTRRAIEAALAADIERIVVTSSVAAIAYGHPLGRREPFTAADWSATSGVGVSAYSESKTRAELEAWSLMEAAGRRDDLTTINPAVVLGPLLGDDPGASPELIRLLLDGRVPLAPRLSFNFVDVRDVAALHLTAMTHPRTGGRRYLASAAAMTLPELAAHLRAEFPAYASRLPRFTLPDWAVRLAALFSPDLRANVRGLGLERRYDTRPAESLLGRPFMAPRAAATATAQSLVDAGLVRQAGPTPGGEKRG